jgi:hypothetical protein
MKKILYALIALVTLLGMTMCTEDEKYIFGENSDGRAEAQLNSYQEILCGAPCGWLVSVGTQDRSAVGGAYQFWMKFTPDNRVVMYADIDNTTATQPSAGSYRMKLMQFPTLMFDTYNYLHLLADPNGTAVPGSTKAKGLLSDFDICLDNRTGGDEFQATGRVHKCPFVFTKATPEDTIAIVDGGAFINTRKAAQARWAAISVAPMIDVDNFVIQILAGNLLRLTSFFYKDENEQTQALTTPTYVDFNYNIHLMEPFSYGNIQFDHIHWNGTSYEVAIHDDNHETYDYGSFMFPLEFGYGKRYSQLRVNNTGLQEPFQSVYKAAEAALAATSRTLTFFDIEFIEATRMRLHLEYSFINDAGVNTNSAVNTFFTINYDSDGYIYLTDLEPTTSAYAAALADNLLNYFLYEGEFTIGPSAGRRTVTGSGNKFKPDWLDASHGAFIVTTDPSNYVPGMLLE